MTTLDLSSVRFGILLSLLTILMGVYLGIHFGKDEDNIKKYLYEKASVAEAHKGDEAKINKAKDDGWKYLKRSHEHFQGLGAISIGLMLLISASWLKPAFKTLLSLGAGLGGFIYPLFWYLVAYRAPELGKHAAKESLALVAQFGAGLFAVSFFAVLLTYIVYAICKDETPGFLGALKK